MAQIKITGIGNQASSTLKTVLNGTLYTLDLYYQDASRSWFMNLRDSVGDPISMGRRVATNVPIFTHLNTGVQGQLAAVSLLSPAVELGRSPWGITHELVFDYDPA